MTYIVFNLHKINICIFVKKSLYNSNVVGFSENHRKLYKKKQVLLVDLNEKKWSWF